MPRSNGRHLASRVRQVYPGGATIDSEMRISHQNAPPAGRSPTGGECVEREFRLVTSHRSTGASPVVAGCCFIPLKYCGFSKTRIRMKRYSYRLLLVSIIALLIVGSPVVAEEKAEPAPPPATTVSDPAIPEDNLKVLLRPLTKEELEAELAGWLKLLRAKIEEVGEVELKLKALPEDDPGTELKDKVIELRTEEAAIAQRATIVAEALKAKGGDVAAAMRFIDAVSDITETTDKTSLIAALVASAKNWISRDDGGKLWLRRGTAAAIILLIAWILSKFAGALMAKSLSRRFNTSNLLENFVRKTAGWVVFIIGVLMAIAALGVQVGPLMAAVGAGGFIVGFAMQETLASFASGMMIMIYRPFDVDDYVNVAGVEGTVKEMSLVSTKLLTYDNEVLIIPNKKAWSETIINYTDRHIRRVDLVFGIGYDDIDHATDVLKQITSEHERVLKDPQVTVHVDQLADLSVNLFCRPWVKTEDYWAVRSDLMKEAKERFDAEGISIPFPQRDLHMHHETVST